MCKKKCLTKIQAENEWKFKLKENTFCENMQKITCDEVKNA